MGYFAKITTNNVPRDIVNGFDVPQAREQYDFLSDEDFAYSSFFVYKGEVYFLGNFMRTPADCEISSWDGVENHSYSDGTLIRFVNDNEQVVVARYYMASDI